MFDNYQVQSDLQRQASEEQNAMYAPQIHEQAQQAQAVLVEQTNPKKVVKEIILRLEGLEEKPDGSKVRVGEPKMNTAGIENIKYILDSYINQNTILSHLDERQISKTIMSISDDLIDDLTLNWKAYGITNKSDLDTISMTVLHAIHFTLNRALEQNEKNWISKITLETLNTAPRVSGPKKEGWFSKFKL